MGGVDPLDMLTTGPEHIDGRVSIAGADGFGQGTDRLTESVRGDQGGDRRVGYVDEPIDEIGKHRTGLHRGQLVRVAHQDQPGVRPNRLQQPGHHGQ